MASYIVCMTVSSSFMSNVFEISNKHVIIPCEYIESGPVSISLLQGDLSFSAQ